MLVPIHTKRGNLDYSHLAYKVLFSIHHGALLPITPYLLPADNIRWQRLYFSSRYNRVQEGSKQDDSCDQALKHA